MAPLSLPVPNAATRDLERGNYQSMPQKPLLEPDVGDPSRAQVDFKEALAEDSRFSYKLLSTGGGRDAAAEQEARGQSKDWNTENPRWTYMKFVGEVVVLCMMAYYVDFGLDALALWNFLDAKQFWFFSINLVAVLCTLVFTLSELVSNLDEYAMAPLEILALGISYPFFMHVAIVAIISLRNNKIHPLLTASKFAEACIEAVVSALIQLYAVIFCNDDLPFANCHFNPEQQRFMLLSVMSSCGTIAFAFGTFDLQENKFFGFPGCIQAKLSPQYGLILLFRYAEVTSRLLTSALFQLVTRPYGGFIMVLVDFLCITLMIYANKGQYKYILPCMCCLVNPLFERDNVFSIPANQYYGYRLVHLMGLVAAAIYYNPENIYLAWTTDSLRPLCVMGVTVTLVWVLMLPMIRCFAEPSLKATGAMSEQFSKAQQGVRDIMWKCDEDLIRHWLQTYAGKLSETQDILQKITNSTGPEERANQATLVEHSIKSLLHCHFNMLHGTQDLEMVNTLDRELAGVLAETCSAKTCSPDILWAEPHDLASALFFTLRAAMWRLPESALDSVFLSIVEKKVGLEVLSHHAVDVLRRYSASKPKEFRGHMKGLVDIPCPCRGHCIPGGERERGEKCDECCEDVAGGSMWNCNQCRGRFCSNCCRARHQGSFPKMSAEETEVLCLIQLTHTIVKTRKKLFDVTDAFPQRLLRHLKEHAGSMVSESERAKDPASRAGLHILALLVCQQSTQALKKEGAMDKATLLATLAERDMAVACQVLPWFPPAVEVRSEHWRLLALEELGKFFARVPARNKSDMVLTLRLIVDYAVSLGAAAVQKDDNASSILRKIASSEKDTHGSSATLEFEILGFLTEQGGAKKLCGLLSRQRAKAWEEQQLQLKELLSEACAAPKHIVLFSHVLYAIWQSEMCQATVVPTGELKQSLEQFLPEAKGAAASGGLWGELVSRYVGKIEERVEENEALGVAKSTSAQFDTIGTGPAQDGAFAPQNSFVLPDEDQDLDRHAVHRTSQRFQTDRLLLSGLRMAGSPHPAFEAMKSDAALSNASFAAGLAGPEPLSPELIGAAAAAGGGWKISLPEALSPPNSLPGTVGMGTEPDAFSVDSPRSPSLGPAGCRTPIYTDPGTPFSMRSRSFGSSDDLE